LKESLEEIRIVLSLILKEKITFIIEDKKYKLKKKLLEKIKE